MGHGETLRYGLVFVTASFMTWSYYAFSHYVHGWGRRHRFVPPIPHSDSDGKPDQGGGGNSDHEHHERHDKGGPFEDIYLKKDGLFLYGLALPLALLALISTMWNPVSSSEEKRMQSMDRGSSPSRMRFLSSSWRCVSVKLLFVKGFQLQSHYNRPCKTPFPSLSLHLRIVVHIIKLPWRGRRQRPEMDNCPLLIAFAVGHVRRIT